MKWFLTEQGFIGGLTRAEEQRARAEAERIIGALGAYHGSYSGYPQELGQLVPEFMTEIPVLPGRNPEWTYAAEGGSFYLQYWVGPSYESDSFTPERGWYMDR